MIRLLTILLLAVSASAQVRQVVHYNSITDLVTLGKPTGVHTNVYVSGVGQFVATNTVTSTNEITRIYSGTSGWSWERTPGTVVATGATTARSLADHLGDIKNAKGFTGVTGDGSTDDTAALTAATDSLTDGDTFFLPPGTYVVDGWNISKNVNLIGIPGRTVIKHKDSATANMLIVTNTAQSGVWQGITFDGNGANQTTNSWYSSVQLAWRNFAFRDCIFTNTVFSSVRCYSASGDITFDGCEFPNTRQAEETLGHYTAALNLSISQAGDHAVHIIGSRFTQDTAASEDYLNSCGVIISGSSGNTVRAFVRDSIFSGYGTSNGGANHLSALDFYTFVHGGEVTGCVFTNQYYQPDLRLNNAGSFYLAGNKFYGNSRTNKAAITIQQNGLSATTGTNNVTTIERNEFFDFSMPSTNEFAADIYIQTIYGPNSGDIKIRNNTSRGGTQFVRMGMESGLDLWNGDVEISGNTVNSDGNYLTKPVIQLARLTGDVRTVGNTIRIPDGNAVGIYADTLVSNAVWTAYGNTITTVSNVAVSLRGVGTIHWGPNTLTRTDGTATTHSFTHDVSETKIALLHSFDVSGSGTPSIVWTNVTEARGVFRYPLTASPNGLITASPGLCEVISTGSYQNGYRFSKSQGTGLGSANWIISWSKHRVDQDGQTQSAVENMSGGTTATSEIAVGALGTQGYLRAYGSSHANANYADRILFGNESTSSGLALNAPSAGQTIDLYFGSSTLGARFSGGTNLTLVGGLTFGAGATEIHSGTGTPEGSQVASVGSLYIDIATGDIYKKISGALSTGWDLLISDTAYNATDWNGVTTIAPSKNAVRDAIEAIDLFNLIVDEADGSPAVGSVSHISFSNGSVTDNGDNTVDIDLSAHEHAGEDITSGTVAAARIDSAMATDAEVAAGYQPLDADLTDLADGSISASKVTAIPVSIGVAASDETTALTTGAGKVTFRMPHAMTVTGVRATLTTASSSGAPAIDINEGGVSILSTTITIDASEKTSTTAATAAVISDTALADDAEITIDIDTAGTDAAGLKVWLIGELPN